MKNSENPLLLELIQWLLNLNYLHKILFPDLVEHLKSLGFPRAVSMDNFSSPNFELVSQILTWMIGIVDAQHRISIDITTEQDRVIFIRNAASFMVIF